MTMVSVLHKKQTNKTNKQTKNKQKTNKKTKKNKKKLEYRVDEVGGQDRILLTHF